MNDHLPSPMKLAQDSQFIKEGIKYMRVKEFTTPEAQNTPTQLFS